MSTSTTVSDELVREFIDDLCSVVIDRKRGPLAARRLVDTGNFEHIYRQHPIQTPRYIGNALSIEGKAVIKIWILEFLKFKD